MIYIFEYMKITTTVNIISIFSNNYCHYFLYKPELNNTVSNLFKLNAKSQSSYIKLKLFEIFDVKKNKTGKKKFIKIKFVFS